MVEFISFDDEAHVCPPRNLDGLFETLLPTALVLLVTEGLQFSRSENKKWISSGGVKGGIATESHANSGAF